MITLIVVQNPKDWPITIPGVEVVSSQDYLIDSHYANTPRARVYNLCRSYRYQSNGYYVSLLAEARKHRPLPSIMTLQDMKSASISRIISEDLDELIQKKLKGLQSNEFTLSIYFGKNVAEKYDRLALKLYNMFEAPLCRAHFVLKKEWVLKKITPIPASEIPASHQGFVVERATQFFKQRARTKKAATYKYDIAILHDPEEANPPSDKVALKKFMRAAEDNHLRPSLITKDEYASVAEYDALFIRVTTQVNHYTYKFARRAEAEGIVVIDDAESIIRCSNKIYLAEALNRAKVATPKTLIIHKNQMEEVLPKLPMPCILKLPDSSFSAGVKKANNIEEFKQLALTFFEKSELILAQEFVVTDFDWRIGVLDRKILYACKYHMARQHWQILKQTKGGRLLAGNVEGFSLNKVPDTVKQAALKAADLMGSGLYGVDLKMTKNEKPIIIEVNDNPSIDAGYEDTIAKDKVYHKIMHSFLKRIEDRKRQA